MAPRTTYAALPDGLNPISLWDQSLADMGSLGIIPCTASGTNAITLTPIASVNAPNVTTPGAIQLFSFIAVATSTNLVSTKIGSTAALPLNKSDGLTQAGSGDVKLGSLYIVASNASFFQVVFGSNTSAAGGNIQYVTAGATVTVAASDRLIVVNKTVGSATTVNLPAASTKNGGVKVVDFKGDAGTNNITVNCTGGDTFNGGVTSWIIGANGASSLFDPVTSAGSSIGYAV